MRRKEKSLKVGGFLFSVEGKEHERQERLFGIHRLRCLVVALLFSVAQLGDPGAKLDCSLW